YMEIIRVFDADYSILVQPDFGVRISHVTLFRRLYSQFNRLFLAHIQHYCNLVVLPDKWTDYFVRFAAL
ncbi:MAG: hypothetical protein ACR2O5_09090, partial [Thiogranum sp.]